MDKIAQRPLFVFAYGYLDTDTNEWVKRSNCSIFMRIMILIRKNNAFIYIKHLVNMNKILNLNSKYLYILTSKIYHTAKVMFNTNTVYWSFCWKWIYFHLVQKNNKNNNNFLLTVLYSNITYPSLEADARHTLLYTLVRSGIYRKISNQKSASKLGQL